MKISFQGKIAIGFVMNILVVLATGMFYLFRFNYIKGKVEVNILDWGILVMLVISLVLLVVVYIIIRNQVAERDKTRKLLHDNEKLLQSVLDNTTNPIFIKKLNGEYMLVNKQYESLFNISKDEIIGKRDQDFMDPETAAMYRQSDLEVLKAEREVKVEEVIKSEDGQHTYIAVKFPLFDTTGRIYAIGGISTEITKRKELEESMRDGDKFFTMSLDILVIASETKFIKFNPALSEILGYSIEELTSRPFVKFIHPDDVEITGTEIMKLKTGVNTVNFENRWICKDGSIKWLSWTASPDVKNGEYRFYAVAHDITENKTTRKSLEMYKKFFNMSYDMMIVANSEYFIKVNDAFTRILGYKKGEMGQKPFLSFNHPDDIDTATEMVKQLLSGKPIVNFRTRVLCKDESYKWLDWTATSDPKTGLMYGVARDVNEQVRLEQEQQSMLQQLSENEQKLRLILENIGEGVIVANHDKQVVLANYMANQLFKNDVDEEIDSDFSEVYELYYPDEQTVFPSQNLPMERAFNGEVTDDVDVVMWDPINREKRRVLLSGRPIIDQNNQVIAAVVTIKDISRYKQMEEELKETKRKYRRSIGFRKNVSSDKESDKEEDNGEEQSEATD